MSIGHVYHTIEESVQIVSSVNIVTAVSEENIDFSPAQKELLRWHYRLGHVGFDCVKFLLRSCALATSTAARRLHRLACKLDLPKCSACQYARQRLRFTPSKKYIVVTDRAGVIRKNNLMPGQEVSVDHFVCSERGRLFSFRGKTADKDMYAGGCIFVDHASNYIQVELQTTLSSHATIVYKEQFESHCRDHGVVVHKYLTDNRSAFTQHRNTFRQMIRHSGASAHHQNGHAEISIQTIVSISRAMMIHAAIHWPDMADTSVWAMAVSHAVFLWNHMPNPHTSLSPTDIFTRSRWKLSQLHNVHVWGVASINSGQTYLWRQQNSSLETSIATLYQPWIRQM